MDQLYYSFFDCKKALLKWLPLLISATVLICYQSTGAYAVNNQPGEIAEDTAEVNKAHRLLNEVKEADRFINKLDITIFIMGFSFLFNLKRNNCIK